MSVCETCVKLECASDDEVSLFSLNDGYWLFSKEYIFTVSCPPGYQCANGAWPRIVKIPAKTFQLLVPRELLTEQEDGPGGAGRQPVLRTRLPIRLNCCVSSITYTLPAGTTLLGITNQVNRMFLQCARQQAHCVNLTLKPTPVQPAVVPCFGETIFPTVDDDGAIDQSVCIGTAINRTITVLGGFGEVELTTSGSLPTGVTATVVRRKVKFQGTPTTAGDFSFTITLSGRKKWCQNNVQMLEDHVTSFEYNYKVFGFTTTSPLPSGTVNEPYSETIGFDGVAPYTYSITAGTLPTNYTLNASTGLISGTTDWTDFQPTDQSKLYNITVSCEDAEGNTCERDFELTVNAPTLEQALNHLVWDVYIYQQSLPANLLGNALTFNGQTTSVVGNHLTDETGTVDIMGVNGGYIYGESYGPINIVFSAETWYIGPKPTSGLMHLKCTTDESSPTMHANSEFHMKEDGAPGWFLEAYGNAAPYGANLTTNLEADIPFSMAAWPGACETTRTKILIYLGDPTIVGSRTMLSGGCFNVIPAGKAPTYLRWQFHFEVTM